MKRENIKRRCFSLQRCAIVPSVLCSLYLGGVAGTFAAEASSSSTSATPTASTPQPQPTAAAQSQTPPTPAQSSQQAQVPAPAGQAQPEPSAGTPQSQASAATASQTPAPQATTAEGTVKSTSLSTAPGNSVQPSVPASAGASTGGSMGTAGEDAEQPQQTPTYEYQATSRPDPFKPFVALNAVNPTDLLEEEKELTGMQLFEPAQLSLVGVMDTPKGRVAMVEDATKKGYTITEGQLIGRHGKVTEIQKDQVLVTETARTRGGDEIKTVVSMKMKRDGEGK